MKRVDPFRVTEAKRKLMPLDNLIVFRIVLEQGGDLLSPISPAYGCTLIDLRTTCKTLYHLWCQQWQAYMRAVWPWRPEDVQECPGPAYFLPPLLLECGGPDPKQGRVMLTEFITKTTQLLNRGAYAALELYHQEARKMVERPMTRYWRDDIHIHTEYDSCVLYALQRDLPLVLRTLIKTSLVLFGRGVWLHFDSLPAFPMQCFRDAYAIKGQYRMVMRQLNIPGTVKRPPPPHNIVQLGTARIDASFELPVFVEPRSPQMAIATFAVMYHLEDCLQNATLDEMEEIIKCVGLSQPVGWILVQYMDEYRDLRPLQLSFAAEMQSAEWWPEAVADAEPEFVDALAKGFY